MEQEGRQLNLQQSTANDFLDQSTEVVWESYDLDRLEQLVIAECPELRNPKREPTRNQMALMIPLVFELLDRIEDPEYGYKHDPIYKSLQLAESRVSRRVGSSSVLENLCGIYDGSADDSRDHLFVDMKRIFHEYRLGER